MSFMRANKITRRSYPARHNPGCCIEQVVPPRALWHASRFFEGAVVLLVVAVLLVTAGMLSGCNGEARQAGETSSVSKRAAVSISSSSSSSSSSASASATASSSASSSSSPSKSSSRDARAAEFSLADAPEYSGKPSAQVNGGVPFFSDADRSRGAFEEYAPLDALGRCGTAFALIGRETMPTEERGSIGMVKPSGWQTIRYDGIVDGNYLYNRCHLIGYQLAGENDNELNLITGTRSMNTQGMQPYEDRVAAYVERTGNHVLYRVTPVFEGNDLVARGVLIEAESVEDEGAGVRFCTWCYNVEPGIDINYATGESTLTESARGSEEAPASEGGSSDEEVRTYVLNTNTHKFHYPYCGSVNAMADHNKCIVESTRSQIIGDGYTPCAICNP